MARFRTTCRSRQRRSCPRSADCDGAPRHLASATRKPAGAAQAVTPGRNPPAPAAPWAGAAAIQAAPTLGWLPYKRSRNSYASVLAYAKLDELHTFERAMVKKTTEQKNAEERRYIAASAAANAVELEPFLTDPNQSIRAVAAMNPDADAMILDRFANDKFWGVRVQVVRNPNVSHATLRRLLESDTRKRGVVHHAARAKLEERGVEFGVDGMPEDAV